MGTTLQSVKLRMLSCIVFFISLHFAYAQNKGDSEKIDKATMHENMNSPEWRKDNFIVNRDSAYANPYYAVQKLKGGNKRFEQGKSIHPRQDPELIKSLSDGQSPFATIVGCSDSRVSSEALFDQGFGDLFVARTAGQVMAQASYASIEYAYLFLNTKLIVVVGHSSCGAVSAAVKIPDNPPGHLVTLINAIKPAAMFVKENSGNQMDNAVRQNVINQVEELRQLESVLSKAYQKGDLLIVGAVYSLDTGKVEFLEETLKDLPATHYSTEDITGR